MKLSLGIVPSINGFGHVRRMISIALAFESFGNSTNFLLPCTLNKRSKILTLISNYKLKVQTICVPTYMEGPYAELQNHQTCEYSEINNLQTKYEFIIADTVTWVADYHTKVYLFAQQLWEFRSGDDLIIAETIRRLRKFRKIFGFKDFTLDSIRNLNNFKEIPLIDYWGLKKYVNTEAEDIIVVSNSGAENLLEAENFYDKNLTMVYGLEKYLLLKPKPIAMICRPGLGAISESLSAGITPILLQYEDPELFFNSQVAISNKWAIDYQQISKFDLPKKILYVKSFKTNHKLPLIHSSFELIRDFIEQESF